VAEVMAVREPQSRDGAPIRQAAPARCHDVMRARRENAQARRHQRQVIARHLTGRAVVSGLSDSRHDAPSAGQSDVTMTAVTALPTPVAVRHIVL